MTFWKLLFWNLWLFLSEHLFLQHGPSQNSSFLCFCSGTFCCFSWQCSENNVTWRKLKRCSLNVGHELALLVDSFLIRPHTWPTHLRQRAKQKVFLPPTSLQHLDSCSSQSRRGDVFDVCGILEVLRAKVLPSAQHQSTLMIIHWDFRCNFVGVQVWWGISSSRCTTGCWSSRDAFYPLSPSSFLSCLVTKTFAHVFFFFGIPKRSSVQKSRLLSPAAAFCDRLSHRALHELFVLPMQNKNYFAFFNLLPPLVNRGGWNKDTR